jgi:hypothetical protein
MISVPYIAFRYAEGELAYHLGCALDELVAFALDSGCPADELEERLEQAVDRHQELAP